jgi:hypothetical protein
MGEFEAGVWGVNSRVGRAALVPEWREPVAFPWFVAPRDRALSSSVDFTGSLFMGVFHAVAARPCPAHPNVPVRASPAGQ